MDFNKTFDKYCKKNIYPDLPNKSFKLKKTKYDFFFVIPVYNEYDYVFDTLNSINQQSTKLLNFTLVVLVINNSKEESTKIILNNYRTHQRIKKQNYYFEYVVLDFYSSKNALEKQSSGVGMARKIGMDYILQFSNQSSLICSLDADTLIAKNYLQKVRGVLLKKNNKACTLNFKHQTPNNSILKIAIRKYERKLKTIALKIKQTDHHKVM